MSFDWSEYLTLAKVLAGQDARPSKESGLRTAISRAYYAAFCKARNFLRDKDKDPQISTLGAYSADVHGHVIHEFRDKRRNRGIKDRQTIGEKLQWLRKERNRADYDDTHQNLSNITRTALSYAEDIISKLDTLAPIPRQK
jgi:uncharacterized protein (UPF0332 family)